MAFACAQGTGGTLNGVSRYLKEPSRNPSCHVVCVEPSESRVMVGADAGMHGVVGIGAGVKLPLIEALAPGQPWAEGTSRLRSEKPIREEKWSPLHACVPCTPCPRREFGDASRKCPVFPLPFPSRARAYSSHLSSQPHRLAHPPPPKGPDAATQGRGNIDEFSHASTPDAVVMANRLAAEEGLLVGPSSGAAVQVAVDLAKRPEMAGKTIVVLQASSAIRYVSHPMWEAAKLEAKDALPVPPDLQTEEPNCRWKSEEYVPPPPAPKP